MSTHIETVIIGAGQAGLAVSYHLNQLNRSHVVLEQAAQAGNAWRNHRWDSFTLNTPSWQSSLPGLGIGSGRPDGFLSLQEIVTYFEDYVAAFQLPVRYNVHVESVVRQSSGRGYVIETNVGRFNPDNVVVATGLYQKPKVPKFSANFPKQIRQLHSDEYRNPQSLPEGAVLVVGSGQSGAQIAEELYQAGRKVYLSVSRAGRVPRRYRGKDANWWHDRIGDYDRTVDQLPSTREKFASKPMISGKDGGHTLNLHQFVRDGVILLGRVQDVQDGKVILAQNLWENLARADKVEADFVRSIDEFVANNHMKAPEERLPVLRDGFDLEQLSDLDLNIAEISAVIWATGYGFDFGMVQLPIFDGDGYPVQKRGITEYPGLYFVGLPWLHNAKSGLLFGVGQDAAHIASAIDQEASRRLPTSVMKRIVASKTTCSSPKRLRASRQGRVASAPWAKGREVARRAALRFNNGLEMIRRAEKKES